VVYTCLWCEAVIDLAVFLSVKCRLQVKGLLCVLCVARGAAARPKLQRSSPALQCQLPQQLDVQLGQLGELVSGVHMSLV
jgi:hypothetical protein